MTEETGYFICPNCGNHIHNAILDTCDKCYYDFGELVHCNFKQDNGYCQLQEGLVCKRGIDYDHCNIYLDRF